MKYSLCIRGANSYRIEAFSMNLPLDRRAFIRICSAFVAFLTRPAHPQATSRVASPENRNATKSRKNFVALQVKPFSWVDEGVDQVLDNLQEKGNVNTIFAYTDRKR